MGGGASRTRELAATFAELAPQHEYLFALSPGLAGRLDTLPPRHHLLVVPGPLSSVGGRMAWEHLYLPRKLTAFGANWILSPFNVLPLGPGLARHTRRAVIVSNIAPFAPEIVQLMHGYQKVRNRLLRTLTLRSLAAADHVFLLSREAGRLLGPVLERKRVTLLPMAPPPPPVLETAKGIRMPDSLIAHPFFAAPGELFPYKGLEDAVRAVGLLRSSGTQATLVVCGNPMDRAYARRIGDLAKEAALGGVTFLRGVGHEQALAIMSAAVAVVTSSRAENPGRVPVEAMALGSPVIAADVPNARDSSGDAALYYPPGDHWRLAAAMRKLLENPGMRADLQARGSARISGLDWTSATRRLLEALELI